MGKADALGKVELGRLAGYRDVVDAPEGVVAELVDGALYLQARPRPRHAMVCSGLMSVLVGEFGDLLGRAGGWRLLVEPALHLGDDVLVPDIAGWRVERFPDGVADAAGIEVAPDWVCELLSPSTAAKDRAVKLPRYGRAGVGGAWLVDPGAETVEVYRRDGDHWLLVTTIIDRETAALPPFEALELPLGKLWYRDPPIPAPSDLDER